MKEIYLQIFGSMLGAALAIGGGIWIAGFLRRREAIVNFRIILYVKLGEIPKKDALKNWNALEFYNRTKPEIRDAISRVEPFLTEGQITALEDLWIAYTKTQTAEDVTGGSDSLATKIERPWVSLHHEEILGKHIKKFLKVVV